MALMAVMTKAMGAFLVIMIMLLPYYTGDNAAQQTVDQANAEMDKARAGLADAQDKLKKGRLTDAEIDELYKRLTKAQDALQEAQKLVDTLREKLDQKETQIARLEDENKSLNEQVERLNDEIEKLRKTQGAPPRVVFMATLRDCGLNDIELYVQSDLVFPDGGHVPRPTLSSQDVVIAGDQKSSSPDHLADLSGVAWWYAQFRTPPAETYAIWLKHRNAIAFDQSNCRLDTMVMAPDGHRIGIPGVKMPAGLSWAFLGLATITSQPDHSFTVSIDTAHPPTDPLSGIDEKNCQDLSCLSPNEAKDPKILGERFSTYLSSRFKKSTVAQNINAMRELAALIAEEKVTPSEAYHWLQIVDTRLPSPGLDQRSDWSWIELNGPRKGMPAPIMAALGKLQSNLDAAEIKVRIEALPDTASPAPEISAEAKRFLDKGLPLDLANAFAQVITDGKNAAGVAEREPHNQTAAEIATFNQLDDAKVDAWVNFLANGSDGSGGSNGWSRRRDDAFVDLIQKKNNIPHGLYKLLAERIARGDFSLQDVLAKADELAGVTPPPSSDPFAGMILPGSKDKNDNNGNNDSKNSTGK